MATPAAIWADEPGGVPGGDERERGEGVAVERRPRHEVHLLVVVGDQGQFLDHEQESFP